MNDVIEIELGDVNDVEAHIYAKFPAASKESGETIEVSGTLRGPYCHAARTLPATYSFRPVSKQVGEFVIAEAIIPDPCLWSPELPHVYHVEVEARRQGRVVATFHGQLGLGRTTPRREGIAFPG